MEVCVDNIESALNAFRGGAVRIELCSALSEGGLTPSLGLFLTVRRLITIDIFVMLRPRRGTDFCYSPHELEAMQIDGERFKEAGADGFVCGVLHADGTIDLAACSALLTALSPKPVTFHRAFDVCVDEPFAAVTSLIELGFARVLTSGRENSALEGAVLIAKLIDFVKNRIIIMPGSGINADNVGELLLKTGANEVHASARILVRGSSVTYIKMGSADFDDSLYITDSNIVQRIVAALKERQNL